MTFYNFFRNIFGAGGNQQPPNYGFEDQWQHRDGFRNPIWQTDEDDDDDDDDDDFRQPEYGGMHGPVGFHIFSDPFEIAKYFENQMDNMLKSFFFGFSHEGMMSPFSNGTEDDLEALPAPEPKQSGSLREEVLKPGFDSPMTSQHTQTKIDADLDGKLSADDLTKVWKEPSSPKTLEPFDPRQRQLGFHSFGKSVATKIVRRPDGTMEQHQTIRDSEGNEETTITRQIGNKTHTVVTNKDKSGVETRTENLINMDEHELPNFEKTWGPVKGREDNDQNRNDTLNYFPWHKFFGPSPKL